MRILRIVLQIFTFMAVFIYPLKMDNQINIFLSKKVLIKINKNYPSYIAYEAVNKKESAAALEKPIRTISLSTESQDVIMNHFHPLSKKVVLNPIIIKKDVQVFNSQVINDNYIRNTQFTEEYQPTLRATLADQKNWVAEFKPYFRKKIQDASNAATWTQTTENAKIAGLAISNQAGRVSFGQPTNINKASISKVGSGANTFGEKSLNVKPAEQQKYVRSVASESPGEVASESEANKGLILKEKIKTEASRYASAPIQNRIVGIVEIGNLPFTNEHHIEIRRYEEGVFRENGTANLLEATYEIFPNDLKGFLLGRLIDKNGKILGEGVVRISDTILNKAGAHRGPKIHIRAKSDISGRAVSSYRLGDKNALAQASKATIFQGHKEQTVGTDGAVKFDNVVRNSTTAMIAESKGHISSQQIIIAGENFNTELIPEKMGVALKQIISDLKQQNLNDPNLSIILGKVSFDGLPISGVNVKIENGNDTRADSDVIYFNTLMLPDLNLTATSENGYFAFIVEGGDMMTLMAYRGDRYFGHLNTVVSPGITSFAEIKNTIKTESVEIKVYDPFTGLPEKSKLDLQGQEEQIDIETGIGSAQLPYLGRWSLLFSNPNEKNLAAHYTYVEKSDYIYVPVLSREWMSYIFSSTKRSIYPGTNIITGFVIDEDYEVEMPGFEEIKNHIIYFDYAGKITDRGTQGGGFILYNLPEGIYEPLVYGSHSQKVYSRIAPLKTSDIFVFTYKLDGSI